MSTKWKHAGPAAGDGETMRGVPRAACGYRGWQGKAKERGEETKSLALPMK